VFKAVEEKKYRKGYFYSLSKIKTCVYRLVDNKSVYRSVDNKSVYRSVDNKRIYRSVDNKRVSQKLVILAVKTKITL